MKSADSYRQAPIRDLWELESHLQSATLAENHHHATIYERDNSNLTNPSHIRVPITSNQQPFIPTHTQLALQVPSAALQAHLVRHPDRLVHGYQPNPSNRNRHHPLINPLLVPLLDTPQQSCSPQQNPRLPAVHQSRPVFIFPHPDHPPSPKSSVTKTTSHPLCSTYSATLLNLLLFCSLNETLCKFQVTTVISIIIITALPITEPPLPTLRSLLLQYLLSLLALYSPQPSPPPPRSRVLLQHLQPQPPHPPLSPWPPEPTPHHPPAPPGGNPRVLLPPCYFRRSPGRLHLGHSVVLRGISSRHSLECLV